MSQISSVASSAAIGLGGASAQTTAGAPGVVGGEAASSTGTAIALSSTSQAYSATSSQSLSLTSRSLPEDRMAALVMALIEIILGLKKKDDEPDDKLLAGLVGLLALSAGRQSGGGYQAVEFSQSSQVTQVSTTTNVAAVQAGAYGRAAGGADGGASTGGSFNTVA